MEMCLLLAWGFLCAFSGGDVDPVETSGELQVIVEANKSMYPLEDDIVLNVKLKNVGSEDIVVFGRLVWGVSGGFGIITRDAYGEVVAARVLDSGRLLPSWVEDERNFVTLHRGHFLGSTRRLKVSDLVGSPGRYRLSVIYRCPVPSSYADVPNLWGPDQPFVKSNDIEFMVVE